MVPIPNLGGDSIYTLCHGPPKAKAYFPRFLGKPKSFHEGLNHIRVFFWGEGFYMTWLKKFLNEGVVPEYIYNNKEMQL